MLTRLMDLWGKLPTTQARVTVTLLAVIATTVRYVLSGQHVLKGDYVTSYWAPSYEWLAFLVVMSGLDAAQFFGKRKTDAAYVAAQQGTTPPADPDPPSPTS